MLACADRQGIHGFHLQGVIPLLIVLVFFHSIPSIAQPAGTVTAKSPGLGLILASTTVLSGTKLTSPLLFQEQSCGLSHRRDQPRFELTMADYDMRHGLT